MDRIISLEFEAGCFKLKYYACPLLLSYLLIHLRQLDFPTSILKGKLRRFKIIEEGILQIVYDLYSPSARDPILGFSWTDKKTLVPQILVGFFFCMVYYFIVSSFSVVSHLEVCLRSAAIQIF